MIEIRAACSPGEVRIAVTCQDILLDAAIWRPGVPDGLDDVHIVRVHAPAPAFGGAFVTLEGGENGFLSVRTPPAQGELVTACISRSAQNGKGLRLRPMPASLPEMPSVPVLLRRGPTPLEELADRYPDAPIILDDAAIAARLSSGLRERLQRCLVAFDDALEEDFESLGASDARIGTLTARIFPTPALVAIDLDSSDTPDFRRNTDSFPELARQIRLRNLSGTILVDPAGVKTRKRQALVPFLREALVSDPVPGEVLGVTHSGLLELNRQRRRPPLSELLSSPHGMAMAALRRIWRENRPGKTFTASIAMIRALEKDPDALENLAFRIGRNLDLVLDPNVPPARWILS